MSDISLGTLYDVNKNLVLKNEIKFTQINKIIESQIAPELQKDGGDIELVDIEDNKVYVKLQGRCSSCKSSVLTLKSFVETTLQDKVSQDIEVIQV